MCNKHLMLVLIILAFNLAVAADSGLETPRGGGGLRDRPQRDVPCRHHQEYPHDNICCLNCPAGTYVKSACTSAHERGTCENCDFDTYTEHDNGLPQCLKCTKCRPDQQTVARCTHTQNTECQCKAGRFCAPDQACEICKKCTICKDDEVKVRNCTTTSNTECKRRESTSSNKSAVAVAGVLVSIAAPIVIVAVFRRKKNFIAGQDSQNPSEMEKVAVDSVSSLSYEEMQNKLNGRLCDSPHHPLLMQAQAVGQQALANEEKDNKQGNSFTSTAHSSPASLPTLPSAPLPAPYPHPCPVPLSHPNTRDDDLPCKKLVPLNGDKSLTDCFSYFEELDVHLHNRFFRHIGLNENAIKNRENLQPEDRVHHLLNVWREKVGMKASINDLIAALLLLNQRLSAENIIAKAISEGHFEYEENQPREELQF
ncbi:hematopoietic death receptor isoform X2 [Hypomesus transpacificus]|uniref:hematopoietic death receptor isoform X2 n=1 Tax=Hypomesus transpacificus TaxID=137520 RepID=UPI001F0840C1|nr:hematopoietic death receptor isoform X2 [Hypomesus transpacificus]